VLIFLRETRREKLSEKLGSDFGGSNTTHAPSGKTAVSSSSIVVHLPAPLEPGVMLKYKSFFAVSIKLIY
jgi:hypothetical protein